MMQAVSARIAATRMLEARYGAERASVYRTFGLAWFQEDAVRRASLILGQRGGVLIADSVGLGKTYIALALIEEHLGPGRGIAVATPAALRATWQPPLHTLQDMRRARGGWIGWVSHARLSRGGPPTSWPAVLDLIVVDEAHAFRNPNTRRYRELARLCRGARIVLLTATPVNNTVLDLYALLRLFAGNGAFCDLGVRDLRSLFRAAAHSGGGPVPEIHAVLNAVLIRRTRPLVRELLAQSPEPDAPAVLRFPERAPPVVLRYDLERTYPGFYDAVTDTIENLSFAAWQAATRSVHDCATGGAAELMRLLLLKRLESSVAAFRASVRAQIRFLESFLEHLHGGRWLTPAENRMLHAADAAGTQLLLAAVVLPEPPAWLDLTRVGAAAAADLARLRKLDERLRGDRSEDPKLLSLRTLLDGPLAGERVLLFSEFRETARWLWQTLLDGGGVALTDGGGAFLGRARATRRQVISRFAPLSNAAPEPPPRERVRLLIATDVLAEGLNLQDARHVVSFDLPWNPVRLIQRVGRIDRLGSPHHTVQAHAFLPEQGLERLLGLLARVQRKLVAIRTTAGAEPDDATFLERIAAGDVTVLDQIERRDAAPFEAEERLRLAWAARQREAPNRVPGPRRATQPAHELTPVGAISGPGEAAIVLAASIGETIRYVHVAGGDVVVDDPFAFDLIARALASPAGTEDRSGLGLTWRDDTGPLTTDLVEQINTAYGAAARVLGASLESAIPVASRSRAATDSKSNGAEVAPSVATPGRVCLAAARALMAAVGREPGGPPPELCTRAERVLRQLRNGLPAGAEQALEVVLRSGDTANPGAAVLLGRLETAISPAVRTEVRHEPPAEPTSAAVAHGDSQPHSGESAIRLVAALVVRGNRMAVPHA